MIYLLVALAGYGALCWWVRARETRMIFYPSRRLEATPAAVGLAYRDLELVASDGVRLHGWFVPAGPDEAGATGQTTVVFLHGNAGNISHRLEKLLLLHELGVNVVLVDYRGYGRSEGEPSEEGTYRDGEAALAAAGTDARNVVVYGESLGTGVAVELAVRHRLRGVILEAPFTSLPDVGQRLFPYLPVRWLARTRYENLEKIGRLRAPLLILHSREDEMLEWAHAERLLAAAAEPKRLVALAGGHNDAFLVSRETYRAALREFLPR
jgi:fermentation-respiration switch protein FrsA (DUF1100 family)